MLVFRTCYLSTCFKYCYFLLTSVWIDCCCFPAHNFITCFHQFPSHYSHGQAEVVAIVIVVWHVRLLRKSHCLYFGDKLWWFFARLGLQGIHFSMLTQVSLAFIKVFTGLNYCIRIVKCVFEDVFQCLWQGLPFYWLIGGPARFLKPPPRPPDVR